MSSALETSLAQQTAGKDLYNNYFDNPAGLRQGAIGSSLAAGSVVGSAIAGYVSDKIGRRDSIMFACLWWLVGTAVQTATNGFGSLIAGRVLNGVCVGITKKENRGQLIVIQQLAIEWRGGILIMYFIGYGCSFISGTASFRTAWGMQFVSCVFLIIGLPFLPRSPRWLAKAKGNRDDPLVVAEWEEITMRKFVYNGMWKRTLAGFTVQMWQQNSGANVMTYYVVYIFMMANLTGNINLISSGIQYALFIIFTTFFFFYIDKTGRRPLLIYGALIMGACHFVVGGIISAPEYVPGGVDGNENVLIRVTGPKSHTVIAFPYLLIIFYALTLAPVCWTYAAGNVTWKMFIIFGVMCVIAAVHFFLTYPQTCGKTLEEIEELFAPGGPKPWHTKPGGSRLDAHIDEVRAHNKHINLDTMELNPGPGAKGTEVNEKVV
ncbi:hypothetical protein BDV12DRAFT_184185 [Aspergillus spectabilis]